MATTSALDDKLKQAEAQAFSLKLLQTKPMLVAYGRLLAAPVDTPDETIGALNAFIQNKAKNGVRDFATDLDYVLQAQQTMPTYLLLYWSGFYATRIAASEGGEAKDFDSFVIAATTDPSAPVHIGLGRAQIIEPSFSSLILQWDKSDVQSTKARLIFNLVPNSDGQVVRTFAGTYNDGKDWLLSGVAKPSFDSDPQQQDKDKFSLPPALQVIFPTIAALGAIVSMTAGSLGMAWIVRQWRDRNIKAREAQRIAEANPGDEGARRDAAAAQQEAGQARDAARAAAPQVEQGAGRVDRLPVAEFDAAVGAAQLGREAPVPNNAGAVAAVAAAVREEPALQRAAAQLAEQAEPDAVVQREQGGGSEEEQNGAEVENGILAPVEPEGEV